MHPRNFHHRCGGPSIQKNCIINAQRMVLRRWARVRSTRITLEAGSGYDIMLLILTLDLLLVAEVIGLCYLRFKCILCRETIDIFI
ncbi:hypothetical protein ASPTUDRAFT_921814 [Aspergillus tubingensis CBS 134.48]|uniref:Uncharacterized protein n=1 Tax=Aspergillus tubingensis (strain CBS 134.48) TaxID=767770 RepID=A0A1L9NF48_ASPTC|nr:hypothetical protein ASPTUDRAFT_921814 [Aspergillus tubingensis CBS 134.48]